MCASPRLPLLLGALLVVTAGRGQVARAQDVLLTVELYDNSTVDPFSTQSSRFDIYPRSSGSKNSDCSQMSIELGNSWPKTAKGKNEIWVDAGVVGSGCQLMFYDAPESDDDWADQANKYCQGLRYIMTGDVSIAYAELDNTFGVAYCCDAACKEDDVSQWTRRDVVADAASLEPLELPRARDVAEAAEERRPPAPRGDSSCTFNATGDPITTYGYESTVSGTMSCPADVDSASCMTEMGYSTSSTVSTYTDNSVSVGISIGGDLFSSFLSAIGLDFSVSSETSTETSNTTTYSTKYTMGPSPGTDGYATFQPKYICSQGEFLGDDCDGTQDLGDWKCAASFTQVNGDSVQPEGVWRMVTVT